MHVMGIISVYIVSKAGGLIFSHDQPNPSAEVEATFSYPLGLVLEEVDRQVVVKYGEKHGIQGERLFESFILLPNSRSYLRFSVGYSLIALNGQPVTNRCTPDGTTAMTLLTNPENFPMSLKFARLRVSINERIMLLSMFHSYVSLDNSVNPPTETS